jgi:hypothetical protein
MTVSTIRSSTNDGYLSSVHSTWATCRDGSSVALSSGPQAIVGSVLRGQPIHVMSYF